MSDTTIGKRFKNQIERLDNWEEMVKGTKTEPVLLSLKIALEALEVQYFSIEAVDPLPIANHMRKRITDSINKIEEQLDRVFPEAF